MAQAAHFYLLLNVICFIHFAVQMYVCLLKVACASQLKQPTPATPTFHERSSVGNVSALLFFFSSCFVFAVKSQFSIQHLFFPLSDSAGILKFHEVYLGEGVSEGGPEFQEGGGGGVISGSSLEQHIASAREALGVESYYSR